MSNIIICNDPSETKPAIPRDVRDGGNFYDLLNGVINFVSLSDSSLMFAFGSGITTLAKEKPNVIVSAMEKLDRYARNTIGRIVFPPTGAMGVFSIDPVDGTDGTITFVTQLKSSPVDANKVHLIFMAFTEPNLFGSHPKRLAEAALERRFNWVNAPRFNAHPQDTITSVGNIAQFSVNVQFQDKLRWQEKLAGGEWQTIEGVTTTPLTFNTTAEQNQAQYRALACNTGHIVSSNAATLTVN